MSQFYRAQIRSPGKLNRKRRVRWQRPTAEHLRHRWWAVVKIMSVHKSARTMRHRWSRRKHLNRKERKLVEHCSIRIHWHQRNQRPPELGRAQKTTTMKWLLLPYSWIWNLISNKGFFYFVFAPFRQTHEMHHNILNNNTRRKTKSTENMNVGQ